jgi:NADH-quinone oxidoreductase subunit N
LRVSSFDDQVSSIHDLKGLNRRNPLYAFLILFIMLSLAGIPPTIGFWAKLSVINLLVNSGFIYIALIAIIFSVVGAFYYLRIIKIVYFDVGDFKYQIETDKFFDIVITINGFVLLSLGLAPALIINMIQNIFV